MQVRNTLTSIGQFLLTPRREDSTSDSQQSTPVKLLKDMAHLVFAPVRYFANRNVQIHPRASNPLQQTTTNVARDVMPQKPVNIEAEPEFIDVTETENRQDVIDLNNKIDRIKHQIPMLVGPENAERKQGLISQLKWLESRKAEITNPPLLKRAREELSNLEQEIHSKNKELLQADLTLSGLVGDQFTQGVSKIETLKSEVAALEIKQEKLLSHILELRKPIEQ